MDYSTLHAAEQAIFFRGLNLNGPSVVIDGNQWLGADSTLYICNDTAFENQSVPLIPPTDPERSKMIRSSRYGGNRVELTDIPSGTFTVFLYVWEDNHSETYSIAINGRKVVEKHQSGVAGHWEKLGPWIVHVRSEQKIVLTSQGGAANFSGIEIWEGEHDGLEQKPTEEQLAFFENRIRPLLVNRCYECHSQGATEVQGELLVDSRASLRRGGSKGPAVVAGDPDHSLIMEAVRYSNDEMQMPPDERLSEEEIGDLTAWIKMGALILVRMRRNMMARKSISRKPGSFGRFDQSKSRPFL